MLKIEVFQTKQSFDIERNVQNIINLYNNSTADVCIFPELSTTGYIPKDTLLSQHFITKCLQYNQNVTSQTGTKAIIFGTITQNNGKLYNSAIVAQNGKVIGISTKQNLPNDGVFCESRYFEPGTPKVIPINGVKFGVMVCEDTWHQEPYTEIASADIVCSINASPFETFPAIHGIASESIPYLIQETKLQRRIKVITKYSQTKPFIYCNCIGFYNGIVFDGNSFANFTQLEGLSSFVEDSLIVEYSTQKHNTNIATQKHLSPHLHKFSKINHIEVNSYYNNQETQNLSEEVQNEKKFNISQKIPNFPQKNNYHTTKNQLLGCILEEKLNAIIFGIKEFVGKSKVVIGLSGGADSALVATLALMATNRENIICVFMPSKYTSETSKQDATLLAKNLGILLQTVEIQPIVELFTSSLESSNCGISGTATENIQARIRGTILMAIANQNNALLLTTGNKSEIATGYCTLYGDMNGAINPIKDLYKTEVFAMMRHINIIHNKIIPENIITKEPSAELKDNQKDSDSLPPYHILDDILLQLIECGKSADEICTDENSHYNRKLVEKIIQMVQKSEFKRWQACPGIKLSCKSFEKDDWKFNI